MGTVFLLAAARTVSAQGNTLELSIKATFLVKFTGFVTWPDNAFSSASSPLTICVVGPDPFGSSLDRAAAGQNAGQHPIEIRRIGASASAAGCHIVFIAEPTPQGAARILGAIGHAQILTVTDLPSSASSKGVINFIVQENHVRFEIDNGAAGANGLRISSQLLALAVGANAPR